jgi:hypothetical protein
MDSNYRNDEQISGVSGASVPLSIVVGTSDPWPAVRDCLDRLSGQAKAVGAEIILAGSGPTALPEKVKRDYPGIRCLSVPDASVFALRARGAAMARGEVVAFTENHCLVWPDWCERMLSAHAEHPDAAAIGGGVLNGSTRRLIDWANYFMTFAPFLPPFPSQRLERIPPAANLSFKRRAIPSGSLSPGSIEFVIEPRLCAERSIALDERILVEHVQSHSLWVTCTHHFHNGRTTAGLFGRVMSPEARRERMRRCRELPAQIVGMTQMALQNKQAFHHLMRASLPFIGLLARCHAVGELAGLLSRSAGRSPNNLQ